MPDAGVGASLSPWIWTANGDHLCPVADGLFRFPESDRLWLQAARDPIKAFHSRYLPFFTGAPGIYPPVQHSRVNEPRLSAR
jgi:hypothetical protein